MSGLFCDGLHIDIERFALVVIGSELAAAAKRYGVDFLRHSNRGDEPCS
jgi:hypothetical protein